MFMRGTARIAALLVLALCTAGAASAQGMFYREELKDERIFVFAQMNAYRSWMNAGGEMGQGMTRIGWGPNGETVVFDSDEAVNLYNFKHDKPGEVFAKRPEPKAPPAPPAEPLARVGGVIFSEYVKNRTPLDKDATGRTIRKDQFELRRAYVNITGAVSDIVSYRITPDIASRQATSASSLPPGSSVSSNLDGSLTVRLKYAYGQVSADRWLKTKGSWLRFGEQQTPYVDFAEGVYRYRFEGTVFSDREGYLSSSDLGVSGRWAAPRDYGDLHVGVYNGESYSKPETNDQKALQARASWRPLPRSAVLRGLRITGFVDRDRPIHRGERNRSVAALTYEHRFANAGFEYLRASDRAGATATTLDADGYSAWFTPRTRFGVEGLMRYDNLRPNRANDAHRTRTLLGAAYWFRTMKSPLAAAVLAEWEHVQYDAAFNKPNESRFGVKTLLSF